MNESKTNRNPFHSALVALLLAFLFLFCGRASLVRHEVVVSVGLKSAVPQTCQVFWTEDEETPFAPERSASVRISPHGVSATFSLPIRRLEKLRFDFGDGSVPVRTSAVLVSGTEERVLHWRDFGARHDISRFAIDDKGAVDVVASGKDPYAVHVSPLGIPGKLRVNIFLSCCLVFIALLIWWPLAGSHGVLWNAVPRRGESVCTRSFLFLALLLVVVRTALIAQIPPWFGPSGWDDGWFVKAADSLLDGRWLGTYDDHTLIKGCFGPMVLAFSSLLGIPFPAAETGLYILGCAFFLFVVSRLARNRIFLLLSFAVLLFNPVSFSLETWQRVYRNGMTLWLAPLVVGGLFLAYRAASKGSIRLLAAWATASGVFLWTFQNSREDGIWIYPFVLACLVLSACRAWRGGRTRKASLMRSLLCFLPFAVLLAGNRSLCFANRCAYGVSLRNDRDAGNYAKAMQDLYLIEPNPDDEARLSSPEHAGHYHNIYYSTLCKAYEASPTLASARRGIDVAIDGWAREQGYTERDLRLDHMLFAIRRGVWMSGYYRSLVSSEEFFGNVHAELSEAFSSGRLRHRGFSITPMAAPFRRSFIPRIFHEWRGALLRLMQFGDARPRIVAPELNAGRESIPLFERISCSTLPSDDSKGMLSSSIDRAQAFAKTYSSVVKWAIPLALFSFLFLTGYGVVRKTVGQCLFDWWLLAIGILASILVHCACIAYVSATTFWASHHQYMAASYQLTLLFVVIVAGMAFRAAGVGGEENAEEVNKE